MLLASGAWLSPRSQADERVYQSPEEFLNSVFNKHPPKVGVLWITPPIAAELTHILDHKPTQLRQRYWSDGKKDVWILEEIGKEEPITAAFVIGPNGRIQSSRVLIYRESRGMEVRYPAFLKQFTGMGLKGDKFLDHPVDGISGATLSVWAMERMARAALYMDQQVRK